jgi:hypothetical protein
VPPVVSGVDHCRAGAAHLTRLKPKPMPGALQGAAEVSPELGVAEQKLAQIPRGNLLPKDQAELARTGEAEARIAFSAA